MTVPTMHPTLPSTLAPAKATSAGRARIRWHQPGEPLRGLLVQDSVDPGDRFGLGLGLVLVPVDLRCKEDVLVKAAFRRALVLTLMAGRGAAHLLECIGTVVTRVIGYVHY